MTSGGLFGAGSSSTMPTLFPSTTPAAASSGFSFGTTPIASSTPSTGLFGTATSQASTASGGLFGFGTTTTTQSSTGGLFGTPTATPSSTGGLFGPKLPALGATMTASTGGGLFGAPTSTIQPQQQPAGSMMAPTATIGLGGTPSHFNIQPGLGLASSSTNAGSGDTAKEGEVPKPILELIEKLRQTIKENQALSDEIAATNCEDILRTDGQLKETAYACVALLEEAKKMQGRAQEAADRARTDLRVAEQLHRRPEFAGKASTATHTSSSFQQSNTQMIGYLHSLAAQYEALILQYHSQLVQVENFIKARSRHTDPNVSMESIESELKQHLQRFEQSFKCIAAQVFQINNEIQDMKAIYLDWYRRQRGPFADNPFEKKLKKDQMGSINSSSVPGDLLKGADAFPSQNMLVKFNQAICRSLPTTTQTNMPSFTTGTSSLFGAKPTASAFSFGPTASTATAAPLFKPFSTPTTTRTQSFFGSSTTPTAPSLFGTTTTSTPSLFGSTAATPSLASSTVATAPVVTQSTPFSFGNTLTTASSGTLFGGSAKLSRT